MNTDEKQKRAEAKAERERLRAIVNKADGTLTFNRDNIGRRGSFSFDPATNEAWSYGSLILKPVGRYLVLNSGKYSNTTTKHQYWVRSIIRNLGLQKRTVDTGDAWIRLDEFESRALQPVFESIVLAELELRRKGARKKLKPARRRHLRDLKKQYQRLAKLGAKLSLDDKALIRKRLQADEDNRYTRSSERSAEVKAFISDLYDNSFKNVPNQEKRVSNE